MRDNQGTQIKVGDRILWLIPVAAYEAMGRKIVTRVAKIEEPTLVGNDAEPSITLTFTIPLARMESGMELVLSDFYILETGEKKIPDPGGRVQ